jgi:hypothetical protein
MRKTAHVFGVVTLEQRPRFHYRFAPVFNGLTFLDFLKQVVARSRRKILLIIDNGPCHNLKEDGSSGSPRTVIESSCSGYDRTRPSSTQSRAFGR